MIYENLNLKYFLGSEAYSAFRLQSWREQAPQLNAYWVYYLKAHKILPSEVMGTLKKLLRVSSETIKDNHCVVVPRLGTISPWSTKATDILHRAGLKEVQRVERGILFYGATEGIKPALYDRMTHTMLDHVEMGFRLFDEKEPQPLKIIPVLSEGKQALIDANESYGWALSSQEIDYLMDFFKKNHKDPSDAELMMFAQANSEHCRHKIFNAQWSIDGSQKPNTLFSMIKNTYKISPDGILSAYKDNAAVFEGVSAARLICDPTTHRYEFKEEPVHALIKVETHNHPTAISPFSGAATGAGGEIRDEGGTGIGSKPKAGLTGFSVSHLHIPTLTQPWERQFPLSSRLSSAFQIMQQGPLGGAAFNNEFGRPNIAGYFRSFEQHLGDGRMAAYHKPIMIAGGLGNIRAGHTQKKPLLDGAILVVLGGPAMKIGLGGGAASSVASGQSQNDLDFASVQRENPEMQRRVQEVIDACTALGDDNPIQSIHDVGAGGLCNAFPELVNDHDLGGHFQLRAIPVDESGMTPLEIWCNESQERYVLAVLADGLDTLKAFAERERCPYAVVGVATSKKQIRLEDSVFKNNPVDVPSEWLFGNPPKMQRVVEKAGLDLKPIDTKALPLVDALKQVLAHPTVADKTFLITIGDRSVTGLVARDQMVGPYQVPVSDVAVMAHGYQGYTGEAMSMGERPPLALISPKASSRMAVGEAITNLAAAQIDALQQVRLSANWMAACGEKGQDAALYEAVEAIGIDLCPALGIAIPVGKDSLSMKASWQAEGRAYESFSPVSCIISAFAPVSDIRKTLTPLWQWHEGESTLLSIDLGAGKNRLGGSIFAEITHQIGNTCPDVDDPKQLKAFFETIQRLNQADLILAYHDCSDGGLWALLCEMAFASGAGFDIQLKGTDLVAELLNEELGAVIQVSDKNLALVMAILEQAGLAMLTSVLGKPIPEGLEFIVRNQEGIALQFKRHEAKEQWSSVSKHMQALRDNPEAVEEAYQNSEVSKPYLSVIEQSVLPDRSPWMINTGAKPLVAILREQGVNGHVEMAAAFTLAGFESVDVHMSDLQAGASLDKYQGLVACGGFSFGDVLGAGGGWAQSILHHEALRKTFETFFHRANTFTLGVCNGCQMLSQLKACIPGAMHWPLFLRNFSEQFEARLSAVRVEKSPSIFLQGLEGLYLPIAVAHGEGRVAFEDAQHQQSAGPYVALRYVDAKGEPTQHYPLNPNGSVEGMTGFTSMDGRATILMPHPERVIKLSQLSWHPKGWGGDWSPWIQFFDNARKYVS